MGLNILLKITHTPQQQNTTFTCPVDSTRIFSIALSWYQKSRKKQNWRLQIKSFSTSSSWQE